MLARPEVAAMSKSGRLRLRDLRAIYRLIGECRDLGSDPLAWRNHLLTELCTLLGAQSAANVEATLQEARDVEIVGQVSAGWPDPQAEQIWLRFVQEERPEADPLYEPLMNLIPAPDRVVTRARHQLVSDHDWYNSRHFHEYRLPAGNNECVYSYYVGRDGPRKVLNCIEVYRPVPDRPFAARQRRMLHWLHHELGPLLGRKLAWSHEPSAATLAPRLRETLDRLLRGDG
jgi:hypothetical protein